MSSIIRGAAREGKLLVRDYQSWLDPTKARSKSRRLSGMALCPRGVSLAQRRSGGQEVAQMLDQVARIVFNPVDEARLAPT